MYNLLVTGEDDAWEATSYRFFRNRFLEYTVEEIAEHFQVLDEDNLEALKSYPCIFAYEGADSEFKIGKITSIKRQTDALEIKYEFDEKITSKKFSEIEQYRQALDIRAWEMNRTHWAVKDADLYSVLGEIIPASISISEESVPLPKAKDAQQHASSVKEFINKVFSFQHDTHIHEVFYRGHSDKQKYKLEPSLFRKDELGNYLYLEKEDILYRELIVSNSSDFLSDSYTLDRLVRMQHYSLPTRLLDITSNPLIALYFTCKSSIGSDGEVVFFRIQKEEIKYYDSDTASCLANLAKLPKHEQNKINTGLEKHEFNEQPVIKRLVHFIRDEKPFFEGQIEPSDLKKIICVKSKKSNERITSQSGAFLSNLFKKTPFSKTGMN
ncbi:MAG: FRG domain-containing protein [Proteobacteria bacterium]|nr:FRG domain-containing protein [Pseudomonadota bacterium]MBU1901904.1 FRG domain-containing protein [Patescibacteria group bacterium]